MAPPPPPPPSPSAGWSTSSAGLRQKCAVANSILCFLLLLLCPPVALSRDLVVKTNYGRVRGMRENVNGKYVDSFLGIPYAKPPVGDLRFKHPIPAEPWEGIFNATERPHTCWQVTDTTYPGFRGSEMWNPNTKMSEDCLYLNVWVPQPRPRDATVMVWIYGGGFYSGTSTLDVYDARIFAAEENVIIASMQYRVGSLGFMYMGHPDAPGNAGLFDQLLALKWVHENIHHFGGNPNRVTLFGESAGAASVTMHLLSPLSQDYFTRAITQSASATCDWAVLPRETAKMRAMTMAEFTACKSAGQQAEDSDIDVGLVIECFRRLPPEKIIDKEWVSLGIMQFPHVPIVDGAFLEENPNDALIRKNFKKTNLLTGSNLNEGNWFIVYELPDYFSRDNPSLVARDQFADSITKLFKYYPTFPREINSFGREAIMYRYTPWNDHNNMLDNRNNLDKVVGDFHFTCPVNRFAQGYAEGGQTVYMYYFTHRSTQNPWPKWMGVLHGDEVSFVFGDPLNVTKGYTEDEKRLAKKMMRYWANFARTGDPNRHPEGPITSDWPVYTPNGKEYLTLDTGDRKVIGKGPRADYCAFWDHYLPHLVTTTGDISEAEKEWKKEFHRWSTEYIVDWKSQFDKFKNSQTRGCK